MRGKILQYNGADGTGTIVADNQQYRFTIGAWKGNTVPVVGKAVDVVVADGSISAIMVVPDDVLLREKTAELGGKLNTLVSGLGSAASAAGQRRVGEAGLGGSPAVGSVVERYGTMVLVAYGLFLVGTLAFNAISVSFMGGSQGRPLYDLATLMSQAGGGGGIKLALLLAYVSVAIPFFWRDRRGWLALGIPLLAVLGAVWAGVHAIRGLGGGVSDMANVFSLGFGFYLSLAAAIVLALGGAKRYLRAA